MSQNLSAKERLSSLSAMQEYMRDYPGNNKKRVIVKSGTEIIFNENISVIAGDYNIYFKVDIIWEDAEFDFRGNGLYGSYSSTYYVIKYEGGVLTIYSDDIVIEII